MAVPVLGRAMLLEPVMIFFVALEAVVGRIRPDNEGRGAEAGAEGAADDAAAAAADEDDDEVSMASSEEAALMARLGLPPSSTWLTCAAKRNVH
jgi:hypothetical protein